MTSEGFQDKKNLATLDYNYFSKIIQFDSLIDKLNNNK